jgi:hypothetical protein
MHIKDNGNNVQNRTQNWQQLNVDTIKKFNFHTEKRKFERTAM